MRVQRLAAIVLIILCSAGLVMGQTVWQDHPDNPVIGIDDPGSWAPGGAWVSAVVHDGTTYHMWFSGMKVDDSGWITGVAVGHATSPDGVAWTMDPANPVIPPGDPGEWDSQETNGGPVIYDGAQFTMWYTGWSEGTNDVGYATSPDGSTWTKYSGNPVMEHGPPGSWDDAWIQPTTVLVEDGTYRMWFHGRGDIRLFRTDRLRRITRRDQLDQMAHPVLEPANYAGSEEASFLFPNVVFDGTTTRTTCGTSTTPPYALLNVHYAYSKRWYRVDQKPRQSRSRVGRREHFLIERAPRRRDLADVVLLFWVRPRFQGLLRHVGLLRGEAALDKWRFIPAAAVASGAQGAFYQTDIDVSNADTAAAQYQFFWLPRGESNTEPTGSETFSLDAGMSVR